MKAFAVLAVFALALAGANAAEDSKVVVLTSKNFDEFIAKEPLALIEFYAPCTYHVDFGLVCKAS